MTETVPASVLVPTIGRVELLRSMLLSVARCDPRPEEVLVVDQSDGDELTRAARSVPGLAVRVVPCDGRGAARARNVGLREAGNDLVLCTDDDCIVASDWVGRGVKHLGDDPAAIYTGRVLATRSPERTPSIRDIVDRRDFTGTLSCSALFTNNMAVHRSRILEMDGFDERLPTAEDNDLCYRWLRSGGTLRYEPDMVVWHHDWRNPRDLARLHIEYARGQGMFYAKHLRGGDVAVLRFIGSDLYQWARSLAIAAITGRPAWSDWRRAIPRGLPSGFLTGWRTFRGST